MAICAIFLLAGLIWQAPAAQAQTVTRYTNSIDSAVNGINEAATPCTARFTRTFAVGSSYTVSDVNIAVLMSHTWRADIAMYLVSPAGTRVQLVSGQGASADNFNLTFDDEATTAIAGYTANSVATAATVVPPYSASFIPSSALSAFDGQNASGTWTLEICDNANADSGTFFQADLYLSQASGSYADLSLAKTVSNAAPATGASITYTLTIANAAGSPSAASGVAVRDLLPTGVLFVSAAGAGSYDSSTGVWTVGTLAAGQNASLAITATVSANAGTSVTNSAEITASSVVDLDSTPNNSVASEDDFATVNFTANATRAAGTAPALSCPAGTLVFDWDNQAWTAGSTTGNFTVTGIGSVGFAINNPAAFLSNATYGGQSPAEQTVVTGGLTGGQSSLFEFVDMANTSQQVRTTVTLGTAVSGAQFRIFDVDYASGQFADKVTVTGYYNGVAVTPVLTNGVSNYVLGSSAFGDSTSADASGNGNLVVTFSAPIDQIVIEYGNHSLAPANPGQQAVAIHDITFCRPVASVAVTKLSSVISDPVNGTNFPKAIPGAVVEYCILVSNTGPATLTSLSAADTLPANFSYAAGSLKTGSNCATATTAEDDDNAGADESDPYGAAIAGTALSASANSLGSGSSFAVKFRGSVN